MNPNEFYNPKPQPQKHFDGYELAFLAFCGLLILLKLVIR